MGENDDVIPECTFCGCFFSLFCSEVDRLTREEKMDKLGRLNVGHLVKTKIVCTLGPASTDEQVLREMISNGMDVARMNFSHGSHEDHTKTFNLIRKLSEENNIPVYVFTDGDPYGYLNIYRTLKVGSGNAAHINEFFCVPSAKFIGVTPQDILDYNLPTHPLKEVDIKRIKDGLKNDPFVQSHKEWQKALQLMVKLKKRAEQQAFSSKHLNYVLDKYLPDKLKNNKTWLP